MEKHTDETRELQSFIDITTNDIKHLEEVYEMHAEKAEKAAKAKAKKVAILNYFKNKLASIK